MLARLCDKVLEGIGRHVRWLTSTYTELEMRRLQSSFKACGAGLRINGRSIITGASEIVIQENVHIGTNAYIRGEGGVEIGANTHISRNLVIYSTNHNYGGACLPYDDTVQHKSVVIGRNVWIGMNVCIAPGTTIGEGAIIGMGCTVFGTIPSLAIVGSAPWQVIGHRDAKHYDRLEATACYGGVGGAPIGKAI